MDDGDYEELSFGPAESEGPADPGARRRRSPLRRRIGWFVAVAALAVAGSATFIGQLSGHDRRPSAAPSVELSRPPSHPLGGSVRGALPHVSVGEICPVAVEHTSAIDVTFTLIGTGRQPVRITRVEPLLPLGGLRVLSVTLSGGTCATRSTRTAPSAPTVPTAPIASGGASVLVSMRFTPKEACPQPFPVQATVHEVVGGYAATDSVAVLNDLGGVVFATCPDT
jgi:hypothetical protein